MTDNTGNTATEERKFVYEQPEEAEIVEADSAGQRIWSMFKTNRTAAFGAIVIILFILCAVLAPFMTPYDPYSQDRRSTGWEPTPLGATSSPGCFTARASRSSSALFRAASPSSSARSWA